MTDDTKKAAEMMASIAYANAQDVIEMERFTRDRAVAIFQKAGATEKTANVLAGTLSIGLMLVAEAYYNWPDQIPECSNQGVDP
jgi:hypothetical protein